MWPRGSCAPNACYAAQDVSSLARMFRQRRRRLSGPARVCFSSNPRIANPPPRSSCHGLPQPHIVFALPAGGRQVSSPTARPLVIPPFRVLGRGGKPAFKATSSFRMPISAHRSRPHHAAQASTLRPQATRADSNRCRGIWLAAKRHARCEHATAGNAESTVPAVRQKPSRRRNPLSRERQAPAKRRRNGQRRGVG